MRRSAVYVRRCAEWALAHLVFPVVLAGTLKEIEERCKEKDELLAEIEQKYGLKRDTAAEDVNE